MKRRQFLQACGVTLATLGLGPALATPRHKRPNILFVMSDDHTSQAIGCYGLRLSPYAPTKNIDRIATEGARLNNCFCTNSICTPSRATILTGTYNHINKVTTLDMVKRLMDYGFHPPTIYFPLVVPGAIMIEPTETESKEDIDLFIPY